MIKLNKEQIEALIFALEFLTGAYPMNPYNHKIIDNLKLLLKEQQNEQ